MLMTAGLGSFAAAVMMTETGRRAAAEAAVDQTLLPSEHGGVPA